MHGGSLALLLALIVADAVGVGVAPPVEVDFVDRRPKRPLAPAWTPVLIVEMRTAVGIMSATKAAHRFERVLLESSMVKETQRQNFVVLITFTFTWYRYSCTK